MDVIRVAARKDGEGCAWQKERTAVKGNKATSTLSLWLEYVVLRVEYCISDDPSRLFIILEPPQSSETFSQFAGVLWVEEAATQVSKVYDEALTKNVGAKLEKQEKEKLAYRSSTPAMATCC